MNPEYIFETYTLNYLPRWLYINVANVPVSTSLHLSARTNARNTIPLEMELIIGKQATMRRRMSREKGTEPENSSEKEANDPKQKEA